VNPALHADLALASTDRQWKIFLLCSIIMPLPLCKKEPNPFAAAYFRKIHLEKYAQNEHICSRRILQVQCRLHAGRRRRDARRTQPECNMYKVYNYMQAAYNRLQAACIRSVNLALGADPSLASTDSQWKQYFYDAQLSRLIPVCYISEKCNTFNYSQGSNQSQLVRSSQCSLKQSDRI